MTQLKMAYFDFRLIRICVEVFGDVRKITFQPSCIQANRFNRLRYSSFGAREFIVFEKLLNFNGLFFGREILGQILHETSQQESTLQTEKIQMN